MLQKQGVRCKLDFSGAESGPVMWSCVHGNKHLCFVKDSACVTSRELSVSQKGFCCMEIVKFNIGSLML
jgi:hypothetical protein